MEYACGGLPLLGLAPEDERRIASWPDAARLLAHLRGLEGPLRLEGLAGYVRDLGLDPPADFARTLLGAPMRHRGVDTSNFYRAEESDDEVDEAVVNVFAAHAAAALASAHTHGAECRTRADLEAVVETSPVGVVRFDVTSGALMLNAEYLRFAAHWARRSFSFTHRRTQ